MSGTVRRLVWLWLAAGVVAWNLTFDLLVTRGVKHYLYLNAEHHAGFGPPVSVDEVMATTVRDGVVAATVVGLGTIAAGLVTMWLVRKP